METLRKLFLPVTATIDYIQNHFKAMLFLLLLIVLFYPSQQEKLSHYNLQRIMLAGPILDTSKVVESLDAARTDEKVKGVMLVVDSPGGAVAPSLEVAYAVKRYSGKKPILVYAKGTLASGAYYASIWADEIIANPGSIVGSIGVIMQGADLQGLMQKLGIKTQVAKAGKYKQAGTVDRPWNKDERAEIEKVINDTYAMFVSDVATARKLDPDRQSAYADAHIFTAAQAQTVGLIDGIGVEYDAKARLAELSGVEEAVWNEESKFEKFFKELGSESATMLHLYFPALSLR